MQRDFKNVARFLLFNPQSPTGHYKLDLRNTSSAYVAQALALLDRWESGLAKRKDLVDISENGAAGFKDVVDVLDGSGRWTRMGAGAWIIFLKYRLMLDVCHF